MATSRPPRLADWLLRRFASGPKKRSLIGDLHEQRARGRSSAWYWRQAISAIAASFAAELSQHKLLAVAVTVLAVYLPDVYRLSGLWILAVRLNRLWYPHLINSRWSWMVTNPWAYRLKPYLWTSDLVWCAILAATTWIMIQLRPRQRGLLVTVFLVTQIGVRAPLVGYALRDWLRDPGNPIWLYGFLWYSAVTFVAIPCSILLVGAATTRRRSFEWFFQ